MALPEPLAPTDADRKVFNDVQSSPRVCAKCLNLVKEERDAPSEEWRLSRDLKLGNGTLTADWRRIRHGGTSSDAIIGFQPADFRRTGADAETWHCGYCGATDTSTPYPSGYSPNVAEMIDIMWHFERSCVALASDPEYRELDFPSTDQLVMHVWTKKIKRDRELTNEPIYNLVPAIVRVSREIGDELLDDQGQPDVDRIADFYNSTESADVSTLKEVVERMADLCGYSSEERHALVYGAN